jgi:hypothetical protein
MKQRPILFNTEMVQAILAGRKTQTRRVVKPQPELTESGFKWKGFYYGIGSSDERTNRNFAHAACPHGKVGDVLWVRETWTPLDTQEVDSAQLDEDGIPLEEFQVEIGYKDGMSKWCVFSEDFYDQMNEDIEDMEQEGTKWKPSIHMPKDAARIWLRIKDVRVERLQDISGSDCGSEGMQVTGLTLSSIEVHWDELKRQFKSLWQSINGEKSWNENPFVWVIEFERIEKP